MPVDSFALYFGFYYRFLISYRSEVMTNIDISYTRAYKARIIWNRSK